MQQGLEAKFSTSTLKTILLETGNKKILEASRYDKYWGIGIGLYDPQCLSKTTQDENQMGKLLMHIRDQLKRT